MKKDALVDLPCYSSSAIQERIRDICNTWGSTQEDLEIVQILASLTDNPNAPDKDGLTPIHAAAYNGHTEIVNILAPLAANPNAAFGDVSKIVASMWDNLDPEAKANYKKRTENAKKDYLKKLAAYRASLVSKGSGDIGYGFSPYGGYHHHHDMKGHFMGQNNSPSGGGPPTPGSNYMGQPIPPRPPMQQAPPAGNMAPIGHHHHHMHHGYMMHGQVIM